MGGVKGIVLAGGAGTRLHPVTQAVSKQLLPVYDKPMVYYPLSVLLLAGVRDVLVITTPEDQPAFRRLLGDGSGFGARLSYAVQPSPRGIAEALRIGEDFTRGGRTVLVLGDNLFFGHGLQELLEGAIARPSGATVFAYQVRNPERYGVVEIDDAGRPVSIQEKPAAPRSPWAVTGLYVYDARAAGFAASLVPSARGELEITDVNRAYLDRGELVAERMGRGIAWLDAGTAEGLLQASSFIQALDARQGLKVGCLEEIAFRRGWLPRERLRAAGERMKGSAYGRYLLDLAGDD